MTFIPKSQIAHGFTHSRNVSQRPGNFLELTPNAPQFGGNQFSSPAANSNQNQPKNGALWLKTLPLLAATALSSAGLFLWAKLGNHFRSPSPAPKPLEAPSGQEAPRLEEIESGSPHQSLASQGSFELLNAEDLSSGVISLPDSPRSGASPKLTLQQQTELRKALAKL